jgi:hypothetical protein
MCFARRPFAGEKKTDPIKKVVLCAIFNYYQLLAVVSAKSRRMALAGTYKKFGM